MNTIVDFYRQQFPTDQKSDGDIMDLYAQTHPPEMLAQYPDFVSDYQKLQATRRVEQSGVGTEIGRGFSRGVMGMESTGAGALALVSDLVGAQGAKEYWTDVYKRKLQEMATEAPASVPKLEDITGFGSGAQYLAGKAGELVPAVGEAAIFAGLGTAAAPGPGTEAGGLGGLFARQAARSAMKRTIERGMTPVIKAELEKYAAGEIEGSALSTAASELVKDASKYAGGVTASMGNFAAQGAGGAYGQLSTTEGVSDQKAIEGALIAGAGSSIGALIPARVLKGIFGEKVGHQAAVDYIDLYAKKVPEELLAAGGGMGAMEFFNILAEKHADPKKRDEGFTKDDYSRLLNSVAVGIMAGTPAVGITALRGVKPRVEPPSASETPETPETPIGGVPEAPAPPEHTEVPAPPQPPEAPVTREQFEAKARSLEAELATLRNGPGPKNQAEIDRIQTAISEWQDLADKRFQQLSSKIGREEIPASREAFEEIRKEKKKAKRPEVPSTPAEDQLDVVTEIRKNNADTVRKVQALFPKASLSREQARALRNIAFPPEPEAPAAAPDTPAPPAAPEVVPGTPAPPPAPAPAMTPEERAAAYPVQLSDEMKLNLRRIAKDEVSGKELLEAEKDYIRDLPGPVRAQYDLIKQEESNAVNERTKQENVQQQRQGDHGLVQGEGDNRNVPSEVQKEGAQTSAGDKLQAAADELSPQAESALASAGIDVNKIAEKIPTVEEPAPPPEPPAPEKITPPIAAAESEAKTPIAAETPKPAVALEPAAGQSLLDRVRNSIHAWKEPRTNKVEEEFYTDIGRDSSDKNKSKALGVFKAKDGSIVVASIYDNKGRKVFLKDGGVAWEKAIAQGLEPIGHIRTDKAQRGFYEVHTPAEWDAIRSQLEEKVTEAKRAIGPTSTEEAAGTVATATGGVTPEGQTVSEKANQYLPSEVPSKGAALTQSDAEALHDSVIKRFGNPDPESIKSNVAEALLDNVGLVKKMALLGKDRSSDIMFEILDVYEETAKEFAERGEGDLAKFRAEIVRRLGSITAKESGPGGESGPTLSDDVRQSRPGTVPPEPSRSVNEAVGQHVLNRLQRAGFNVQTLGPKIQELLGAIAQSMGSYDRATKTITWALSDLTRPTNQDIKVLFEEAGHALFDHESPEMRDAVMRAVSQLGVATPGEMAHALRDVQHAYPEGVKPEIFQEEMVMGILSRRLSEEGFNPIQSRGIAQSIVRMLKEIYLKTAMWFQQTAIGRDYANPDLAMRYFQNRMEGFLAGDQETLSWTNRLGAVRATHSQRVAWGDPAYGSKDLAQTYNSVTGKIDTVPLVQDSVSAALANINGDDMRYSVPAPGAPVDSWVDHAVALTREISVTNKIKFVRGLAAALAGIDPKRLAKINGLSDLDKIASAIINDAVLKGADNFVRDQQIEGFTNEENWGPAYRNAVATLHKELSKISKNLTTDRTRVPEVLARIESVLKKAQIDLDRYKDAQFMGNEIQKGVRELTKDDLRKMAQTSRSLGVIMQQVANLDQKIGQPVDPAVVTALRRLFTGDELQGQNLFNLLDIMANDGAIDFRQHAYDIRETIRQRAAMIPDFEPYQRLVQDTPEGRALLGTVVAYGKLNGSTLELLRARRMESGEKRLALEQQLRDAWKESREQIDTGVKRVAKGAKLEEAAKIEYRRTMADVLKARRDVENINERIAANEAAIPAYNKAIDQIASKISLTQDSTFASGMKVRVPETVDGALKWTEQTIKLNSAQGPVTTPQQIESMASKIDVFMIDRENAAKAGDDTALGRDYQNARRQLMEIVNNRFYQEALRNTDLTSTGLMMSSERRKMGAMGTPAGSALEVVLSKFQSDATVMRTQADREFGYKNPRLKRDVLDVVNEGRKDKISPDWFTKYLLNSVFGFMEKMQPTEGSERPADLALAWEKLGNWLLTDELIKPLIEDRMPQFMKSLRELVDARYESGQYWQKKNVKAGLLVEDPKLGGQLRQAFRVGLYTFQRKFSDTYFNLVHDMRMSGWNLAVDDFKNAGRAYSEGGSAAVHALTDKYFDNPEFGDRIRNDFLYRLTHVPSESTIETPAIDESGTTRTADPETVARVYDEVGGDVVAMFERLHDIYNGQNSVADYVQDGLVGLTKQFKAMDTALKKMEPKGEAEVRTLQGLIPNAMIDARQFSHWPGEWFDYHEFDRNDNARMAERVSGQINFGRDTQVLANLHSTLKAETDAYVAKLRNVMDRAERETPTGKPKAIDAAAEKMLEADPSAMLAPFKTGKERLQFLRKMEARSPSVTHFLESMSDYFNRGNQTEGALKWGIRLSQELASLLVNQPSSAISQLATMFDIPVQWGASPTMLGRTARTVQLTGKDIAGSLAQALGFQFMKLGEYESRYKELLQDPESARRFGDISATLEGEQHNKLAKFFRVAKDVQSTPINLVGEQARYTQFRPLAPFFQFVNSTNRALTVSLWELADNYVRKGVKYIENHPGTEKITPEMLGLKGLEKDGFERWAHDAGRYGLEYTDMVNQAKNRLTAGERNILDDQQLGRLYSMGLNEISLEPSIATMPMWAFNNSLVRFVIPLLGWSFRRAVQVGGGRLDTKDQNNLKALSTALLGLAATGLGGLGLSLVVDEYQERVLGKKRNIRDLNVPTSLNDWMGLQERLARIGTLGLWGEAINSAVNVGTGQGDNRMFSADQRIVALQSFQSLQQAISAAINQGGDIDYQHVVRPAFSALGGGGLLQYAQIANHAFDLDNVESRVVKRTNAQNYLRVVGRELGMDVKVNRGGFNTPTPVTPWIARMEFAAYGNDPEEFRSAYRGALEVAKEVGKDDAPNYVKRAFETRHPLRSVFTTVPTEQEYRKLLGEMDDRGTEAVTEAVRMFNYYGSHLGIEPFAGSAKKKKQPNAVAAAKARAFAGAF